MPTFDNWDDLQKHLEKIANSIPDKYSKDEIFNNEFMNTHTKFSSLAEFFAVENIKCETQIEFDALSNNQQIDDYVFKESDFNNWSEMLTIASVELAKKQLDI